MQTPEIVAKRALCLSVITLRAQAENHLSFIGDEPDHFHRFGDDVMRWARSEKITAWHTDDEREELNQPLGSWDGKTVRNNLWRQESLIVLLWSMGHLSVLPSPFEHGTVDTFIPRIPLYKPVAGFIKQGRQRPKKQLETELDRCKFLNWRSRTELLRLQGFTPPDGDTFEAAIRRAIHAVKDEPYHLEHNNEDILYQGTPFNQLPGPRRGVFGSVAQERHTAMAWLCAKKGLPWDEAYADT